MLIFAIIMVVFGILLVVDYSTGRNEVCDFNVRSLGGTLVGEFYAIGTIEGKEHSVEISYPEYLYLQVDLVKNIGSSNHKVNVYKGGLTGYKYNIHLCG